MRRSFTFRLKKLPSTLGLLATCLVMTACGGSSTDGSSADGASDSIPRLEGTVDCSAFDLSELLPSGALVMPENEYSSDPVTTDEYSSCVLGKDSDGNGDLNFVFDDYDTLTVQSGHTESVGAETWGEMMDTNIVAGFDDQGNAKWFPLCAGYDDQAEFKLEGWTHGVTCNDGIMISLLLLGETSSGQPATLECTIVGYANFPPLTDRVDAVANTCAGVRSHFVPE